VRFPKRDKDKEQEKEPSPIARKEIVQQEVTDAHKRSIRRIEAAVLVYRLLLRGPGDGSVGRDEGHTNLTSAEVLFGDLRAERISLRGEGDTKRLAWITKGFWNTEGKSNWGVDMGGAAKGEA
jgi:hypothetical protein